MCKDTRIKVVRFPFSQCLLISRICVGKFQVKQHKAFAASMRGTKHVTGKPAATKTNGKQDTK